MTLVADSASSSSPRANVEGFESQQDAIVRAGPRVVGQGKFRDVATGAGRKLTEHRDLGRDAGGETLGWKKVLDELTAPVDDLQRRVFRFHATKLPHETRRTKPHAAEKPRRLGRRGEGHFAKGEGAGAGNQTDPIAGRGVDRERTEIDVESSLRIEQASQAACGLAPSLRNVAVAHGIERLTGFVQSTRKKRGASGLEGQAWIVDDVARRLVGRVIVRESPLGFTFDESCVTESCLLDARFRLTSSVRRVSRS